MRKWYECPKCGKPDSSWDGESYCGPCEEKFREEVILLEEENRECPICFEIKCTRDHEAEEYDPEEINRPDLWPSWWTEEDAKSWHEKMMTRREKAGITSGR